MSPALQSIAKDTQAATTMRRAFVLVTPLS